MLNSDGSRRLSYDVTNSATAKLARAARDLFDNMVTADISGPELGDLVEQVERLANVFATKADGKPPIDPRMPDSPAHSQIARVPWRSTHYTGEELEGRARFRLIHAGSAGVAHGGAIAFLFDEVMGVFANSRTEGIAWTAWIRVEYRRPTPVGVDLNVHAHHQFTVGRKQTIVGTLHTEDGVEVARAEGLFLAVAE